MATKTIGSGQDYTTIALWSAYVKALGTLTENEIGQLTDDASYTYGATADLDFSGVTLSGFTITLRATTNKHDGDFGNGSRVEADVTGGGLYIAVNCIVEDFSLVNTNASGQGARCFQNTSATLKRVIAKSDSSGNNAQVIRLISGAECEACRAVGGTVGFLLLAADVSVNACTTMGNVIGFGASAANTATCKNNAAYNCGTDWDGSWNGTYSNNASEDGTHPGTAGVTLTGDPFDGDGYTPATSGQLDGAGVDLGISLDAANNPFNPTPSIGSYESISLGGENTVLPLSGLSTVIGSAPSVTIESLLKPSAGAVNEAGYAPSIEVITAAIEVSPLVGINTEAGYAANVSVDNTLAPESGLSTEAGFAPSVEVLTAVIATQPLTGLSVVIGSSPDVAVDNTLLPQSSLETVTGYAPNVQAGAISILEPLAGIINEAGYAPEVRTEKTVQPILGVVTESGSIASVTLEHNLKPGSGAITESGFVPSIELNAVIVDTAPSVGTINVIGLAPTRVDTRIWIPIGADDSVWSAAGSASDIWSAQPNVSTTWN